MKLLDILNFIFWSIMLIGFTCLLIFRECKADTPATEFTKFYVAHSPVWIVVNQQNHPEFICRSKTHATIVGRKAEACPTYVTERKARAQLRQTMQRALGIYGKREVEGAIRSFRCEWQ